MSVGGTKPRLGGAGVQNDRPGFLSKPHHTACATLGMIWSQFSVCNILLINSLWLFLASSQGSRRKTGVVICVG